MFVLLRSIKINTGQVEAAFQWAVEICHYVNDSFPGHNVRAHRQWLGNNEIYWLVEYESLAEFEQLSNALNADEGYMSWIADANNRGLFVAGSLHDKIIEQIG